MKYLFSIILLLISFTSAQEKLDISFHIDSIDFRSGFARSSINVVGLVAMKNTCNDKVNWTETLSIDKHNPIKKDIFKINVETADDTALDFCFLVCSGPIRKRDRLSVALDRAASDATNRGIAQARQLIAERKLRPGGNISIARHLLQELQGIRNSFVQNPKITFLGQIIETTRIRFAAFTKARVVEKTKTFKVDQGQITIKYRVIIVKKRPEPKFDLKVKISQIRCAKTRGRGSDNILILGGITRNKRFDFVFGVPTTMRDGMKTNFPDTPTGHVTTLRDLKPDDNIEIGLVFFKENTPKNREMRNEVANQIFHKMKVSRGNISVVNASIKGLKTAQQPNADRVLGKYTRTTKMKDIRTTTQKWLVESSKPGASYKYTIRIQYIKITRKQFFVTPIISYVRSIENLWFVLLVFIGIYWCQTQLMARPTYNIFFVKSLVCAVGFYWHLLVPDLIDGTPYLQYFFCIKGSINNNSLPLYFFANVFAIDVTVSAALVPSSFQLFSFFSMTRNAFFSMHQFILLVAYSVPRNKGTYKNKQKKLHKTSSSNIVYTIASIFCFSIRVVRKFQKKIEIISHLSYYSLLILFLGSVLMKYIIITLLSVVWTFGDAISIDVPLGTSNLSVVSENTLNGFLSSEVISVDPSLKNLDIFSSHLHLAISGSDILGEDTVFTTKVTVFRESPVVILRAQGLVEAQKNVVKAKQLIEEANVAVAEAQNTINEKQIKLEEARVATQETRIRLDEAQKNLAAAKANAAEQGLKKTAETIAAKEAVRQAKTDVKQATRDSRIAARNVNIAEKGKRKAQKGLKVALRKQDRAQVRLKRRQVLLERAVVKQGPRLLDEVLISAQDIQTVGQGAGFDFDVFVDLQDSLNRVALDKYFIDEVFIFRTFVEISASGITNATVNGNETLNITFGAVPETSSYVSVLLGLMILGFFSMRKRLHQDKALSAV